MNNTMNRKIIYSVIAIGIVIAYIFFSISHLITDYYWYTSIHAVQVYWKILNARMIIWSAVFLLYFTTIYINLRIALVATNKRNFEIQIGPLTAEDINKFINSGIFLVALFLAFISAAPGMELWDKFLKYQNETLFHVNDPVFHKDVGFYFFELPLILSIKNILISLILLTAVLSGVIYFFKGAIQLVRGWYRKFSRNVKIHMGVLLILLLLLFSLHFWLLRYDLLYSGGGVVFGAGYTDVHTRMFGYTVTSVLLFCSIFVVIYFMYSEKLLPVFIWLSGSTAAIFIFLIIAPAIQQKFFVEPNELEKEKPFIINNIQFTRQAYDLNKVNRVEYSLDNVLTKNDIVKNKNMLQNIRLWDWRPLLATYRQIQELRLYYTFDDVDVDRYKINNNYRQLMLSVRELAQDQMAEQAKTWVNERLRYTHGYGLVASPVDVVTKEGMPELVIKDIPPASAAGLKVDRPGIYFGERTDNYIFTGTGMDEFDYPLGEKNQLTRYTGTGGVPIGSFWKRLLYAVDMGSFKILISQYLTKDTKILYHRDIRVMAEKIAPYLTFDSDPYISIINGELKWILDAYTTGRQYPYAEPVEYNVNYIRNSVKVVIDAYDGSADFYIMDTEDPVIQTYQKMFPGFFKSADKIPPELKKHFRYPVDMFIKQAKIFLSYHMTEPEVFYNREDSWKFPREVYQNHEEAMAPYYTIMQLDENQEEFLLILPFTPSNKNNMIAWLSAGSDGANYGKLNLYEFPKKELVYGPMQIEARIDQTPDISEVLTLWNQQGSSVIRGDLLVIPLNHTLLYVEPLYLQAEKSKMPELKRVIVSYKNQIVMKETLDECLKTIFNMGELGISSDLLDPGIPALAGNALMEFREAQRALQQSNWAEYGKRQKEIESLLQQIQKKSQK